MILSPVGVAETLASCSARFFLMVGGADAAGADARLVDAELGERGFERFRPRWSRSARDGEIAREAPHRIAGEHRVLADGGELAVGLRRLLAGDVGHVGLDDDREVGLLDEALRVEAHVHRMARRQAHRALPLRDDRDRVFLGKPAERRDRALRDRRDDDQRLLGRRDPFGERRDRCGSGCGGAGMLRGFTGPIGSGSGAASGSRGSTR